MKYNLLVSLELAMVAIMWLPRYRFACILKSLFLTCMGAKVGKRVVIYPGVWILTGRKLVIGDDVDLAMGVLITTDGGVSIGSRTLVGYRTQILSSNHRIPSNGGKIFGAGHVKAPISIGSDAWIGANCVILPGVTIGQGCVIGAGSIVTRDLPPLSVAAGVPAKVIKTRS